MTRPNILLITSDQQHWSLLGSQTPQLKTPHLDHLAGEGTLFERAYCPNPTCTPTRASIITGLYPSQHGAWSLGTKLSEQIPVVGDRFSAQGYRTALVGKAHFQPLLGTVDYPSLESFPIMQDLAFWRGYHGPFYGFQEVELARMHADEAHVGQHYAIWMEEQGARDWRRYFQPPTGTRRGGEGAWELPHALHPNTWIAERTEERLRSYAESEEPFLLWSSFFDPHPPYLVPEPWASLYDPAIIPVPQAIPGEERTCSPLVLRARTMDSDWEEFRETGHYNHGCHPHLMDPQRARRNAALYWGMMTCLDVAVGRILAALERLDLARNTLVVFTTDHGHLYGQHGLHHKGPFHYEDLIKVPFIARHPGRIPAGIRNRSLLSTVDLAPTFLGWCGLPIPGHMTGIDQGAVLRSERKPVRDHVIVEFRHEPTTIFLKTLVNERYKVTIHYAREYGELYDLEADPQEATNLWDDPGSQALKHRLLERFLHAELGKESLSMPRIASA
jgi:arylsulfatase A-like enzyme